MESIKKLELYRLENKITQQDLAKELGVAFSTVSRWFNRKTTPSKIQQYHVEKYLSKKTGKLYNKAAKRG
ncbi:MAG: transcriptional regulator [Candidatus Omnitrophica bacterium CG_4_9_14_0_2_um_filter_42_8]|nr:MAG: transcriptional regulator [Candidatus Omnitrophica bacterium CG22_combo_CG10-13_8_21_14_all_43_16]PJC47104.1 MAG: transcriptional regulator [Candidatus Omnitrophica bacterium CG_4_9_14_0_2_um_filter_42_8]